MSRADVGEAALRLAGLVQPAARTPVLGLVYVAALRRSGRPPRGPEFADVRYMGNTDLTRSREAFDPVSALLIDHLVAL